MAAAVTEAVNPTEKEAEAVEKGAVRTIVAAVDESKFAEDVFKFVHTHFNDAGTKVVFVHVAKPLDSLFNNPAVKVDEKEAKKHVVDAWMKRAEELKALFQTEAHVLKGDAREELQSFTRLLKPDALVLGSHGLGAVKRAVLGSVSNYCVHHCPCPVTVIRRVEDAPSKDAPKEGVIQNAFQVLTKGFLRREKSVEKKEAAKEVNEVEGQPAVEVVMEEVAGEVLKEEPEKKTEEAKEGDVTSEIKEAEVKDGNVKTEGAPTKDDAKEVKESKESKEGVLQSALHALTKPFAKKEKPVEKASTVAKTEPEKEDVSKDEAAAADKEQGKEGEVKAEEAKDGELKVEEVKGQAESGKEEVKDLKETKDSPAKEGVLQNALHVITKTFAKKEKPAEKKEAGAEVAANATAEEDTPKEEMKESKEGKDSEVKAEEVKEGELKVEEVKEQVESGKEEVKDVKEPKDSPAKEGVFQNALHVLTKTFTKKEKPAEKKEGGAEAAATAPAEGEAPKEEIKESKEDEVKAEEVKEETDKVEDLKPTTPKSTKSGSPKGKEGVLHNAFQALSKSFRRKSAEKPSTSEAPADVVKEDGAMTEEAAKVEEAKVEESKVEESKVEEIKPGGETVEEVTAAASAEEVPVGPAVPGGEDASKVVEGAKETAVKVDEPQLDEPKVEAAEGQTILPSKELQAGA